VNLAFGRSFWAATMRQFNELAPLTNLAKAKQANTVLHKTCNLFKLSNIREGNNTLAEAWLNKLLSAELRFLNCFVFLAALA
jgi:hypothetical protein